MSTLAIIFLFMVEIMVAIIAIKKTTEEYWAWLWLEADSKLLALAFTNLSFMPWYTFARWMNCIKLANCCKFKVVYIKFQEYTHPSTTIHDFDNKRARFQVQFILMFQQNKFIKCTMSHTFVTSIYSEIP